MADGNPFASILNPNAQRAGLFDLRMMAAANRSDTPYGGRGRSYGHQGIGGNPMLSQIAGMGGEPDYSVFTSDPAAHAAATQALAPYGVSPLESSQVQRNTILPNQGFFGNHPTLSRAIEGGIYSGLAAHGGDTIGDSIQGTLEGLVGGKRLQQGAFNKQFARPFEAAGMLEGLQDMRQKRDLQDAEIQHYRALNQKLGRPDHDFRSMGNAGPQDKYIPTMDNTSGEITNVPNPNYDPALVRASHQQPGAGTSFDRWVELRNSERKAHGQRPMNSDEIKQQRGEYFASPVAPGAAARNAANAPVAKQKWVEGQLAKPGPTWMAAGVSPGDPQAAAKLGKYYDENLAPFVANQAPEANGPAGSSANNPIIIP